MQNGFSQPEDAQPLEIDPDKSIIATFRSQRKAHEAGLAILAAGGTYWVYPDQDTFVLVVRRNDAKRLGNEVRIYGIKNRFWPRVSPDLAEQQISRIPTFLFLLFLVLAFLLQGSTPEIEALGMNSSKAFWNQNQWWRLITAVALHADLGHLMGNLFGMGLFGYFTARYLGNGLGWMAILATACVSNLTNVIIHMDSDFLSLGASTAVFGALGLVTGFPVGSYLRTGRQISKRQWLIPLSGGLMLLAWLGGGTVRTDVAGHLWGFLAGLLLAGVLAKFEIHAKISKKGQAVLLVATWTLLILAWLFALKV